jgi:hypothetical protein
MQWTRRLWEMTAETANGRRGFLGGGKGKVAGAEMARAYLFEGLVVDKAGSIFGHLELTFLDLLAKLPRREREQSCVPRVYAMVI